MGGEVGFDGVLVESVDCRDAVVEGGAELGAEIRSGRDDVGNVPVFVVAPGVHVCAEELGVAGEIKEEVGVVVHVGVGEDVVDGVDKILLHGVLDVVGCIVECYCTVASAGGVVLVRWSVIVSRI